MKNDTIPSLWRTVCKSCGQKYEYTPEQCGDTHCECCGEPLHLPLRDYPPSLPVKLTKLDMLYNFWYQMFPEAMFAYPLTVATILVGGAAALFTALFVVSLIVAVVLSLAGVKV